MRQGARGWRVRPRAQQRTAAARARTAAQRGQRLGKHHPRELQAETWPGGVAEVRRGRDRPGIQRKRPLDGVHGRAAASRAALSTSPARHCNTRAQCSCSRCRRRCPRPRRPTLSVSNAAQPLWKARNLLAPKSLSAIVFAVVRCVAHARSSYGPWYGTASLAAATPPRRVAPCRACARPDLAATGAMAPIHSASKNGDLEGVKRALSDGADVNGKDSVRCRCRRRDANARVVLQLRHAAGAWFRRSLGCEPRPLPRDPQRRQRLAPSGKCTPAEAQHRVATARPTESRANARRGAMRR